MARIPSSAQQGITFLPAAAGSSVLTDSEKLSSVRWVFKKIIGESPHVSIISCHSNTIGLGKSSLCWPLPVTSIIQSIHRFHRNPPTWIKPRNSIDQTRLKPRCCSQMSWPDVPINVPMDVLFFRPPIKAEFWNTCI